MKKLFTILTAIYILFLSTGCATIFGHSSYNVTINSNPPKSEITIIDKKGIEVFKGTTPATVKLKSSTGYFSKGQYQVKYHLTGYQDKTITIDSKLNGWYFGNLLLGGVIGMLIIDPASGAMYKIKDTTYTENLEQSSQAQATELKIIDINSLPASAQKNLIKLN